jgi:hypothetical protein
MPDDDALLARVINFHELSRDAEFRADNDAAAVRNNGAALIGSTLMSLEIAAAEAADRFKVNIENGEPLLLDAGLALAIFYGEKITDPEASVVTEIGEKLRNREGIDGDGPVPVLLLGPEENGKPRRIGLTMVLRQNPFEVTILGKEDSAVPSEQQLVLVGPSAEDAGTTTARTLDRMGLILELHQAPGTIAQTETDKPTHIGFLIEDANRDQKQPHVPMEVIVGWDALEDKVFELTHRSDESAFKPDEFIRKFNELLGLIQKNVDNLAPDSPALNRIASAEYYKAPESTIFAEFAIIAALRAQADRDEQTSYHSLIERKLEEDRGR